MSGADPSKENPQGETYLYEAGWKDACAVFFYSLVCIVMHAIAQEYFLDVSFLKYANVCNNGILLIYDIFYRKFQNVSIFLNQD